MFVGGRAIRGVWVEKSKGQCQRNVVIINFNEVFLGEEKMETREDNRMVKLDLFSKLLLLGIY